MLPYRSMADWMTADDVHARWRPYSIGKSPRVDVLMNLTDPWVHRHGQLSVHVGAVGRHVTHLACLGYESLAPALAASSSGWCKLDRVGGPFVRSAIRFESMWRVHSLAIRFLRVGVSGSDGGPDGESLPSSS